MKQSLGIIIKTDDCATLCLGRYEDSFISCVCGETENAFGRDRNSLFLLVCPRRIFDNQRVTQTEKGSDLTIYAAPFFCCYYLSTAGYNWFSTL